MEGVRGPHPEAWQVARDSALGRLPLPGPAPGRTRVQTPRSPPRGEPSPSCGPAGLGGQGAVRAKGEGPAAAWASACGGGRRGRTRTEGEGSHLGEVPGWSQPPGAERFSCPPRLSPADPESLPEKKMPRASRDRGAARSRRAVREPRPAMQDEGFTELGGAWAGCRGRDPSSGPQYRPRGRTGRQPLGALDAALPAERCWAAGIPGGPRSESDLTEVSCPDTASAVPSSAESG